MERRPPRSPLFPTRRSSDLLDSGRIFLEGEEITRKNVDVSKVRQKIGIVFQQFNLFPHLRVIDNLTLAARRDRKSTRLNSSHANISYAVFCLKKKRE